jgi:hypothetical protein
MSYPRLFSTPGVGAFAEAVDDERHRQIEKWGDQRHPDGTGQPYFVAAADVARKECQSAAADGSVTWRHILAEEVGEAFAETDSEMLAGELVQCAAVIAAWLADLARRPKP